MQAVRIGAALLALTMAAPAWAGSWNPTPYLRPNFSFQLYGTDASIGTAVGAGALAGVRYFNDGDLPFPAAGRTRVGATALLPTSGGSGWGHDVRLGSFFGPSWKLASAELGLDVFHNGLTIGSYVLDRALGLDIPLNLTLGPEQIFLLAGATPTLMFDPDRQVDWSQVDAFGFGHEFEWRIGGAFQLPAVGFGITYTQRIIAPGVVSRGFGLGVYVG